MSEQDERIAELEAERDKLWKETLSLRRECEQHMRARNVLTTEKQELEHLLEHKEDRTWGALSEQIGNLKAERDKLAAKRDEYWKEVVRLNVAYEDLEVERDELRRELDDARSYIEHLETAGDVTECDELEAERDQLAQHVEYWRKDAKNAREEFQQVRAERDELRRSLARTSQHAGDLNDAIVEALWGEGKAFDQLSDAVKAAVLREEPCECETCECMASEDPADPIPLGRIVPLGPSPHSNETTVEERALVREADRVMADESDETIPFERILSQFVGHWMQFAKPRAELWEGMPYSPLNPRPHTLSKDCWCNPTAEDYREAQ